MNPLMTYSKTGLQLTERFEGCRLESYPDTGGVWTIAYGHTHSLHPGMTCTPEQAQA
jgi:lysozyme